MKRRQVLQLGTALGVGLLAPKEAPAGELGRPLGPYGARSPFEKAVRWRRESKTPQAGSSFSPLADSSGILTPSSLQLARPWLRCTSGAVFTAHSLPLFPPHSSRRMRDTDGNRLISSTVKSSGRSTIP